MKNKQKKKRTTKVYYITLFRNYGQKSLKETKFVLGFKFRIFKNS